MKPLTFEELSNIYVQIAKTFPVNKRGILLKFHPDKLLVLGPQTKKYPQVSKFVNWVFDNLKEKSSIDSERELRSILAKHKHLLEATSPPRKQPPPPPPPQQPQQPASPPPPPLNDDQPYSYHQIKHIYVSLAKDSLPMNRDQILGTFYPDRISQLGAEMDKYGAVYAFAREVFDDLMSLGRLYEKRQITSVLEKHKWILKNGNTVTYVLGLGCTKKDQSHVVRYVKMTTNGENENVYGRCNTRVLNIVKNIVKTYCYLRPTKTDSFVVETYQHVKELIQRRQNVVLLGNSYGGCVVALVCELLNKKDKNLDLRNLHAATFGSIYISPKRKVNRVDLTQYMYVHDVALKCANMKPPVRLNAVSEEVFDNVNNVVWLKSVYRKDRRWEIHNDYGFYIERFMGVYTRQVGGAKPPL